MEVNWLTTIDVARILGVSVERVRKIADAGELPTVRTPGGQRLYDEVEVRRLLRAREGTAAAAASR